MTAERYRQIKSLLMQALDVAPEQRTTMLNEACEGDAGLRVQVEMLLEHHERATAEEFLSRDAADEPLVQPLGEQATRSLDGDDSKPKHGTSPHRSRIESFGNYENLDELGRGGMGVVYRAWQPSLKRDVALKMILTGKFAGGEEVRRFRSEAAAAAGLRHPAIVPIYEVGSQEGHEFYSMAFIEGSNLDERLKDGPLPSRDAAALLRNVADAVHYAHENGVIHRDLKPANILLDEGGSPHVSDFGLAKQLTEGGNFTQTGQVVGTPSFMPPEQARGETVGPAADVYSLGAVLYSSVTGRPPFQAPSVVETLNHVQHRDPVSPRQLNPVVERDLETIILHCLHKEPEGRYASARELSDELERYLDRRPIHARPITSWQHAWKWCRRNPGIAAFAAAVMVLLISIALVSTLAYLREANLTAQLETKKDELGASLEESKKATHLAEQRLAENSQLLFVSGRDSCEQGEIGRGLLSMAAALDQLPAGQKAMDRVIRLNLSGWDDRIGLRLIGRFDAPAKIDWLQHMAISPDGRLVVYTTPGHLQVLDGASGEPECPRLPNGNAACLVIEPKSNQIVVGNWMGEIITWDLDTQMRRHTIQAHAKNRRVRSLAVGRNGVVVSGGADGALITWDVEQGKPIHRMTCGQPIWKVAISEDNRQIVAGCEDSLESWRCDDFGDPGSQPMRIAVRPSKLSTEMTILGDEESVFVAELDGLLEYSTRDLAIQPSSFPPRYASTSLIRIPNSRALVSAGSGDRRIRVVDHRSGRMLGALVTIPSQINGLAATNDGKRIYVGSKFDGIWAFSWQNGASPDFELRHGESVCSVAVTRDGQTIVSASEDGEIRVVNAAGKILDSFRTDSKPLSFAALTADAKRIALAAEESIELRRMPDGKLIQAVTLKGKPNRLVWNNEGTSLFFQMGSSVRRWDLQTQMIGPTLHKSQGTLKDWAVDPAGAILVASESTWDNLVRRVNLDSGKTLGEPWTGTEYCFDVDCAQEGSGVLTTRVSTIFEFDVETGERIGTPILHPGCLQAQFSPNGNVIVSVASSEVRIWDRKTRRQLGPPLSSPERIAYLAVNDDASTIVAGGRKTTRVWRRPPPFEGSGKAFMERLRKTTGIKLELEDYLGIRDAHVEDAQSTPNDE